MRSFPQSGFHRVNLTIFLFDYFREAENYFENEGFWNILSLSYQNMQCINSLKTMNYGSNTKSFWWIHNPFWVGKPNRRRVNVFLRVSFIPGNNDYCWFLDWGHFRWSIFFLKSNWHDPYRIRCCFYRYDELWSSRFPDWSSSWFFHCKLFGIIPGWVPNSFAMWFFIILFGILAVWIQKFLIIVSTAFPGASHMLLGLYIIFSPDSSFQKVFFGVSNMGWFIIFSLIIGSAEFCFNMINSALYSKVEVLPSSNYFPVKMKLWSESG